MVQVFGSGRIDLTEDPKGVLTTPREDEGSPMLAAV